MLVYRLCLGFFVHSLMGSMWGLLSVVWKNEKCGKILDMRKVYWILFYGHWIQSISNKVSAFLSFFPPYYLSHTPFGLLWPHWELPGSFLASLKWLLFFSMVFCGLAFCLFFLVLTIFFALHIHICLPHLSGADLGGQWGGVSASRGFHLGVQLFHESTKCSMCGEVFFPELAWKKRHTQVLSLFQNC